MKPFDLAVYDQYPVLAAKMLAAVKVLGELPLPEMRQAVDRLALSGIMIGASHGRQVDPAAARRQGLLIDAITRFIAEARRISEEGMSG